MPTAGIVIDKWKLPIFKKRLEDAGYEFSVYPCVLNTLTLKVSYVFASDLKPVIEEANKQCAKISLKGRL